MSGLIGNPVPRVCAANGFPHPLPPGVVLVVGRAIRHVWQTILDDPSKHLVPPAAGAPEEDRYTDAIANMLEAMLGEGNPTVAGFSSEYFDCVSRSESIVNYSGAKLNKQPDLIIRMANSPLAEARRLVGVFIEAKVVSASRPIAQYTTNGLQRFVAGDYSWAMQAGVMLAYQRPNARSIGSLETSLAKDAKLASLAPTGVHVDARPAYAPFAGVSKHGRAWLYADGDSPGEISIWHFWDLPIPV